MFMDMIEKFKKEELSKARERAVKIDEWRKAFVAEYPRNSILPMTMDDYLTARGKYGKRKSFCQNICSEMEDVFRIMLGNKLPATFGIAFTYGTRLTLSKDLADTFDKDYDKAFMYIKKEIVDLLNAADKDDYSIIENCKLDSYFACVLLFTYFPEKFLPVFDLSLLSLYYKVIGAKYNWNETIIYNNVALLNWKNNRSEFADWSNVIFISFLDWIYRKGTTLIIKSTMPEIPVHVDIIKEIEKLNLQGKSKEAVVKVRVNQGIFRHKLLQRYSKCCLCGVSDSNLLVASHIKPWCECQPDEKLDCDNGFLMCPNHDKLFDEGWITFDDDGKIIIADRLSEGDRIHMSVKDNMKVSLTGKNKQYLQFHREYVFQNS